VWRASVIKCQVKCCQLVIDTAPCDSYIRDLGAHICLKRALLRLNPALTMRLLQEISCPCCGVDGYLMSDWQLRSRMRDVTVQCPYVSNDGRNCQWIGLYGDFWKHEHLLGVSRKRTAADAELETGNDDISPAAKRPTVIQRPTPNPSSYQPP